MNTEDTIKVWDIFVRFFHWSLVLTFFIAYLTEDDFMTLHTAAGYSVLALISLRLVWGVIGSHYARFKYFVYPLAYTKTYIKALFTGKAERYVGHNPAGGLMIVLLLIALFAATLSGVLLIGTENSGPFASLFHNPGELIKELLEEVHEFFANVTLLLVCIHVAGVIFESVVNKENLIKSMITGFKKK